MPIIHKHYGDVQMIETVKQAGELEIQLDEQAVIQKKDDYEESIVENNAELIKEKPERLFFK